MPRRYQITELIRHVFVNDLAAVQKAVADGADVNEPDSDGRPPLIHAAIDNKIDIAKVLLQSGANPNVQDYVQRTALHYTAQDYHPEIASLLLSHGAWVDVEDLHGNTALWDAVSNAKGRGQIVKLLLRAGADRNHRNKYGKSPLDIAGRSSQQFFD